MSFSSYNPHDRYRRRSAKRTNNIVILFFLFLIVFGGGYWIGGLHLQQNMHILQEENNSIIEDNDKYQIDMVELRAVAQTANVRLEQLKASYNEILSEGSMRDILTLVRKQIEQGVDVQRLKSVILSARPPQNCSDPDSKRFVVITPVYNGPASIASINKGLISISGKGLSSKNSKGGKEAWFDPVQPVSIKFKVKGRELEVKKGLLPLHHSMVVGDKEFRFTITSGAKSFVKITFDHCDYP